MSAIPDSFNWRYTGGYPGVGTGGPGAGGGDVQPPGDQWLRRWSLVLGTNAPGSGPSPNNLVLSTNQAGEDIRLKFDIRQADAQTPNTCILRAYNLSDATALQAVKQYTRMTLSAGYLNGRFGVIFDGIIKQFKKGRESTTETYLDLFGADGDAAYNAAMMNMTLAAGSTSTQRFAALTDTWQKAGVPLAQQSQFIPGNTIDVLPRDRVYFGMATDETREFAKNRDATWNIVGGKLTMTPNTAYDPGEIVVLNSGTGMVGFPESTNDGVMVTALLNPSIRLRQRIQINNKDLNLYFAPGGTPTGQAGVVFPGYQTGVNYFPSPAADGIYCALVIDYAGDTRAPQPWYTIMTCLAVDPSSGPGSAINALG